MNTKLVHSGMSDITQDDIREMIEDLCRASGQSAKDLGIIELVNQRSGPTTKIRGPGYTRPRPGTRRKHGKRRGR